MGSMRRGEHYCGGTALCTHARMCVDTDVIEAAAFKSIVAFVRGAETVSIGDVRARSESAMKAQVERF